jgi:hypothetical protein
MLGFVPRFRRNTSLMLILASAWIGLALHPICSFAQQQTASLSGTVMDSENKETLVGATVSIKTLKIGAITNKSGFFSLKNIPAGKHQVTVSFLGFAKKEISLEFASGEAKKLTIELKKQITKSGDVTVTAERGEAEKRQISVSQVNIPIEQLSQIRIGGEADIFRAIQFLPGVLSRPRFQAVSLCVAARPTRISCLWTVRRCIIPATCLVFFRPLIPMPSRM